MHILSIDCALVSMAYAYAETDDEFKVIKFIKLCGLSIANDKIADTSTGGTIKLVARFFEQHIKNKIIDLCIIEKQMSGTVSYDISIALYALCIYNNIDTKFYSPIHKNKLKLYKEGIKEYSTKHATNEYHTYRNFLEMNPEYEIVDYDNSLKFDVATSHVQMMCVLEAMNLSGGLC